MAQMFKSVCSAFIWLLALGSASAVCAGQLNITNKSASTVTCLVDGYTIATGWAFDWAFKIPPGVSYYIGPSNTRSTPIINWANCGPLTTRNMNITPDSSDGLVLWNGQQNRVLNVSLYPYIPQLASLNFSNLTAYVTQTFQSQNPQVLLNAVMNGNLDIYSYTGLPALLNAGGFDVIELDMLYLGFIQSGNLITPQTISGDTPWPVAQQAASIGGQLWAIPSWLCTNFLFSYDSGVDSVVTLANYLTYAASRSNNLPEIATNLVGSWGLPSSYLNAYVQQYGFAQIASGIANPADPTVIDNLVQIANTCNFGGLNNCINGGYKVLPNGGIEQLFANGKVSMVSDYSEQSFFILNDQKSQAPLYVSPMPWGPTPSPLLYADGFVTNAATCSSAPCSSDSTAFTTLMTSAAMKNYITSSTDDPSGTAWRRLLVATKPFWSQPAIQSDPLYQRFAQVLNSGNPFPNYLTAAQQTSISQGACAALKAQLSGYACNTGS